MLTHGNLLRLAQLSLDFDLFFETTGLACNYLDRYLAMMVARACCSIKRQMRMIASVCVVVAAKFYDCHQPSLQALGDMLMVPADQLAALECMLLNALGWNLHVPLPHAIVEPLKVIVPTYPSDDSVEHSITVFIDNSLESYELLDFTIAEIAAGAMLAACACSETVMRSLPTLARACATVEHRLIACSDALLRGAEPQFPIGGATGACIRHVDPLVCVAGIARRLPDSMLYSMLCSPLSCEHEEIDAAFERLSKRTRRMHRESQSTSRGIAH